jgi:hypothetical protein
VLAEPTQVSVVVYGQGGLSDDCLWHLIKTTRQLIRSAGLRYCPIAMQLMEKRRGLAEARATQYPLGSGIKGPPSSGFGVRDVPPSGQTRCSFGTLVRNL